MENEFGRCKLVIGIGCEMRGDDVIGLEVVRRLRSERVPEDTAIVELVNPIDAVDLWADVGIAVVVDAVVSGVAPGTIHRFEASELTDQAPQKPTSGHGLGIAEAMILGRILGRMPESLTVIGIEAAGFEPGRPVTAEVAASIEKAIQLVHHELDGPTGTAPDGSRPRVYSEDAATKLQDCSARARGCP